MGETLLTIKNLSAWYSEEKRILSEFSFSLVEHELALIRCLVRSDGPLARKGASGAQPRPGQMSEKGAHSRAFEAPWQRLTVPNSGSVPFSPENVALARSGEPPTPPVGRSPRPPRRPTRRRPPAQGRSGRRSSPACGGRRAWCRCA